jgi:hypothetical protein
MSATALYGKYRGLHTTGVKGGGGSDEASSDDGDKGEDMRELHCR